MATQTRSDQAEPSRFRVYTLTPLGRAMDDITPLGAAAVYTPDVVQPEDEYRAAVMLCAVRAASASALAAHRARERIGANG